MHHTLVPDIHYEDDLIHVYGKSIPTDSVGGDLLDLYATETDIICYLADVSGHGVRAGLTMGMFKTAMHMNIAQNRSPAMLLQEANNTLYRLTEKSMFLTCACIQFSDNYTAEFAIAGHLPILHFKKRDNSIDRLMTKQIAISIKPDYPFLSQEIVYEKGDLFILLSDGLIETRNKNQEEFGMERIETILLEYSQLSLEALFDKVITDVNRYGNQYDDQTLMLICCS
jgi:sigma-B regulation protein RsbU (phosphoserine phosphatase)